MKNPYKPKRMVKEFYADPSTDRERFNIAVKEANDYSRRYNYDTAVFKNLYGFYLIREVKFCPPEIVQLYVAVVALAPKNKRYSGNYGKGDKLLNRNTGRTR